MHRFLDFVRRAFSKDGMSDQSQPTAYLVAPSVSRPIALWLFMVTAFLVGMIVVGGATRLTDSGLSITEWKPVTGAIPPLSEAAWQAEFEKYQQIPEYRLQNRGMSLSEFKSIYRWEWGHRLLGRLIGFVVLIPMLVFAIKGQITRRLGRRLLLLLGFGAFQGALGWWMVSSGLGGLDDRLDVSAYRLATHMGMALLILGFAFWTALDVHQGERLTNTDKRFARIALGFMALVWVQAILGAFVAGTDGGFINNTWPMMDGGFLPEAYGRLSPFWRNFFENPAAAQFDHRMGAYLVLASAIATSIIAWKQSNPAIRQAAGLVLVLVCAQVLLGIWTLLAVTPVPLGIAHQALGALVFLSAVRLAHNSR
ncbi:MAG: COX15/CtaA family protein [Robiginitomaculum sp.]|nr:COX15/CtaA family protein [Robiginitomaculum sp.]MDQ7079009.1 COX15/CtaA family protein [Robiginitomaculum sp.]